MNILIIEDNQEKMELVKEAVADCFNEEHVDFVVAETWGVATKYIYEIEVDVIIADLMVPERPGGEVQDIPMNL